MISFHLFVNEVVLDGNVFKDNTVSPGSNFLDLKNIRKITMRNNKFYNITMDSVGQSANLINVRKEELTNFIVEGNEYRDSNLNFMMVHGLTSQNITGQEISLDSMIVNNLTFDISSQVFTTGNFFSDQTINVYLKNSEFTNIKLKALGKLFHI